jgi:hypothetical protein
MSETTLPELPRMKGDARMAKGATAFDVPLFSQIEGDLWQGCSPSEFGQEGYAALKAYKFDAILNLFPWGGYTAPNGAIKVDIEMYDSDDVYEELDDLAMTVNAWLDEGKKVLVHCQAGLNRSSLVVARSLMMRNDMTAAQAIGTIRRARSPMCLCNDGFVAQLAELERMDLEGE